jgi:aldehyde dehydrogenase (NAD+)
MQAILSKLGLAAVHAGVFDGEWSGSGPVTDSVSPIDGSLLARVREADATDTETAIGRAHEAFLAWRETPAPVRGETIRRFGNALRAAKLELAELITWEMGKILAEAEGEVQEMIDICDFALGLSRQLHGRTIVSERPRHRLMEQWHPLGVVGVITAFNFPVAVWSWNSVLAAVCGDAVVWKPSHQTPLCAIAATRIAERVCRETGANPAIFSLVCGASATAGEALASDRRVPLVSATGSCAMGRRVGQAVHARLGRTLPCGRFSSERSARQVSAAPRPGGSSPTKRWRMLWSRACGRPSPRCGSDIRWTAALSWDRWCAGVRWRICSSRRNA